MSTSTISPVRLQFDVSTAVGTAEELNQVGWLFFPDSPSEAIGVLVCSPGGTFDKHYWHLEIDGYPGYSFAEHFTKAGYIVVAVDHLGVGESTDPVASGTAGIELLALGDAEAARQIREGLRAGELVDGLEPLDVPVIGIGHSMGAALTAMVQAKTAVYDALVLLGFAVECKLRHTSLDSVEMEAQAHQGLEAFCQTFGVDPRVDFANLPRPAFGPLFHAADVPQAVIDADAAVQSRIPVRAASEVIAPGFLEQYASQIAVPVFLCFGGAIDAVTTPHMEPTYYPQSSDVTLHLLAGSAHLHNLSSGRKRLWDRIAAWLAAVM